MKYPSCRFLTLCQGLSTYQDVPIRPSDSAEVVGLGKSRVVPLSNALLRYLHEYYLSIDERYRELWQLYMPVLWEAVSPRHRGGGRWISRRAVAGEHVYMISRAGLPHAIRMWAGWEGPSSQAGEGFSPNDKALCRMLQREALMYSFKKISIAGTTFVRDKAGGKQAMQSWGLVHKAADDPRMYFVHIKDVYRHQHCEGQHHYLLHVDWHLCGASSSAGGSLGRGWDPNLMAPVFPQRCWRGPALISAGTLVPLHVSVLPHPTRQGQLVALPCNRDPWFVTHAGFLFPPL